MHALPLSHKALSVPMGPIISSKRIPTSLSYAYTGNRRNAYSYDLNGNVTSDAVVSQFVCLKWTIEKVINNRHPAR